MNDLANRAMLADLTIRTWTSRKVDKKTTKEVHEMHNVDERAGHYIKPLLAKEALAEIVRVSNAARLEHYARTLPWQDNGSRILSALGYFEYSKAMNGHRDKFESAVKDFLANYEEYKEAAKVTLNGLFDESEYPSLSRVASKFKFHASIYPIPVAADFRVDLGDEYVAEIQKEIENNLNEIMQAAIRDVYSRIAKVVGHMVDKLYAYKPATDDSKAEGIFRDSLVENIKEMVELIPTLNVTNDPELANLARRLNHDLCDLTAEELRESEEERKHVAKLAESILLDVQAYVC